MTHEQCNCFLCLKTKLFHLCSHMSHECALYAMRDSSLIEFYTTVQHSSWRGQSYLNTELLIDRCHLELVNSAIMAELSTGTASGKNPRRHFNGAVDQWHNSFEAFHVEMLCIFSICRLSSSCYLKLHYINIHYGIVESSVKYHLSDVFKVDIYHIKHLWNQVWILCYFRIFAVHATAATMSGRPPPGNAICFSRRRTTNRI